MSQLINIPQIVGGNTAYVGFTGGTGGLSSSQKILTWTYTTESVSPAFSPVPGTYTSQQSISLNSATSDAVIYYTADGSKPTAAATRYTGPIQVTQSETVKAIAISKTYGSSNVVSAAYVIQPIQPAGTFSLNASQATPVGSGTTATSNITITPANGFTGVVSLTCAVSGPSGATDATTCSVSQSTPVSGSSAATATLTVNTQSGTSPGTYTVTISGSSGGITAATSVQVTVAGPTATPLFTLGGSNVSIPSAGGNATSIITITPSGGFTGAVVLSCAVAGPAGTVNPPTCSISQPQAIAGTQAMSATLTVSTNGATTAMLNGQKRGPIGLGGCVIAALALFCIPMPRRRWHAMLCLLFAAIIATAASGCGGGSSTQNAPDPSTPSAPTSTATSPGTYTVTVTGTSGSQQATATVAVIVQ
jgi:Chitobiase/beta-hexosaminidase C-terminal domain